jgi:glucokinase
MAGLIADIGGTNVRFALVGEDEQIRGVEQLRCADFATLFDACESYLASAAAGDRPKHAALAVASPLVGDEVRMTNHPWTFSIEGTRRQLGLESLDVINDFIAVALGVPHLTHGDVARIGGGEADPRATMAVLGAGTGLGMAGLVRTAGGGRIPLSSEGGHVTMPATDDREEAILAVLRGRHGHVSAERVLSGPGLVNLYHAIAELQRRQPDPNVTPADCTARGIAGTCPISVETLQTFCRMLGTIASNLALTLDARGGVFIGGGIVPKLGDVFASSGFRSRFEEKGRFGPYLSAIPTAVITRPLPAFAGLAALVAGH